MGKNMCVIFIDMVCVQGMERAGNVFFLNSLETSKCLWLLDFIVSYYLWVVNGNFCFICVMGKRIIFLDIVYQEKWSNFTLQEENRIVARKRFGLYMKKKILKVLFSGYEDSLASKLLTTQVLGSEFTLQHSCEMPSMAAYICNPSVKREKFWSVWGLRDSQPRQIGEPRVQGE